MVASPFIFTTSQANAFQELIESTRNLFITGGPGTGKTFLIQKYLAETKEKIPVLASTGAAAILIGGRTFHSFFGLGIMQGGPEVTYRKALKNSRIKKRIKDAKILIIDEISMLSHETLDCAERIAAAIRKSDEPWGGIRVIAVGDFAQLPPISRGNEQKPWAFLGEAWANSRFKVLELKEVKRTEDEDFHRVLGAIRRGQITDVVRTFLDTRVQEDFFDDEDQVTHIFPRRSQTEYYNRMKLEEINAEMVSFKTEYGGESRAIERLQKEAPIPPELHLKKSALVMLRINDPKQRFVNGSLAVVEDLEDDKLTVRIKHRLIDLEKFSFTFLNADGEEVAFAKNFPVSLAYASTIHKIQGATLDRAHLTLKALWEPGQAYVALSRVRRAEDLSLEGWSESSIMVDPLVQRFYRNLAAGRG